LYWQNSPVEKRTTKKKERDKEHQETPKNQREKNAQQHKNSIVTFKTF